MLWPSLAEVSSAALRIRLAIWAEFRPDFYSNGVLETSNEHRIIYVSFFFTAKKLKNTIRWSSVLRPVKSSWLRLFYQLELSGSFSISTIYLSDQNDFKYIKKGLIENKNECNTYIIFLSSFIVLNSYVFLQMPSLDWRVYLPAWLRWVPLPSTLSRVHLWSRLS